MVTNPRDIEIHTGVVVGEHERAVQHPVEHGLGRGQLFASLIAEVVSLDVVDVAADEPADVVAQLKAA